MLDGFQIYTLNVHTYRAYKTCPKKSRNLMNALQSESKSWMFLNVSLDRPIKGETNFWFRRIIRLSNLVITHSTNSICRWSIHVKKQFFRVETLRLVHLCRSFVYRGLYLNMRTWTTFRLFRDLRCQNNN